MDGKYPFARIWGGDVAPPCQCPAGELPDNLWGPATDDVRISISVKTGDATIKNNGINHGVIVLAAGNRICAFEKKANDVLGLCVPIIGEMQ
jgi:hypothetical protein